MQREVAIGISMHDYVVVFCFGVQEFPAINELVKATNSTNLGLIRDVDNSSARKARRRADILVDMFRQSG